MCCCKGSRKAKANEKERYQTLFHGEKNGLFSKRAGSSTQPHAKDEIKTFVSGHVKKLH